MLTGTSYFTNLSRAYLYYAPYGLTWDDVGRKLEAGEIHIGAPSIKRGEKLVIIDGGRYGIEDSKR